MTASPQLDPVTVEVIRNALIAASAEMMINVKRAAYSPSIYEIQDVCVGLLDADARMLSCAPGLPLLLADVSECVRDGLKVIGREAFRPGDVYLSNDPYTIGTHVNNLAAYLPIFWEGGIIAFAVVRGHMVDLGGAVPGSRSSKLTEIYQEGLRLRQIRFHAEGRPVADVQRLIADNTRMPDEVLGDLRAEVAACKTGERRVHGLIEKYGWPTVRAASEEILRQGRLRASAAVDEIPDGFYEADGFLDDDGIATGTRIPLRVRVVVKGAEMTIDFTGMPPQTQGSINTGPSGAAAIARTAFKCLTTPVEPVNEGHFDPLKIVVPPGTIISAGPPAACGWWSRTTSTTIDLILTALSGAIPDRVPAAHFGDIPMCLINGTDLKGRRFVFFEPVPGGHGGRPHEDGVSATVCFHEGDTPDVPVEVQEASLPILVEESSLECDSGGPGKYRGGLGYRRVFRLLATTASMQLNVERHHCPPWGLFGGMPGKANAAFVEDAAGASRMVLKADDLRLAPGSRVVMIGGGGGGWGSPRERDPDAVRSDVENGYVSAAAARKDYGVALDPVSGSVDARETARLRDVSERK